MKNDHKNMLLQTQKNDDENIRSLTDEEMDFVSGATFTDTLSGELCSDKK